MSFYDYLEDHFSFILSCILFLFGQSTLLYFLGNTLFIIILLNVLWCIIFIGYFSMNYIKKRKRFSQMDTLEQQLDKKYLLNEVLPKGGNFEEKFYKHMLYVGNKSMIEEVSMVRRDREQYQEYVEQWVHEIKTPIAAMKLWCENQQVERKRDLQQQLERTESYVEQALYFARSEHVGKDLHIHRVDVMDCIHESIQKNKYLCLHSGVRIEVSDETHIVYSDEKWLTFVLNQLIENAVKYRKQKDAYIQISVYEEDQHIAICLEDNGKGICAQDVPRIFEKGFTGENGRSANKHATGIGLYLCRRLCNALAIDIHIESKENMYTKVYIIFPKESYKTVTAS